MNSNNHETPKEILPKLPFIPNNVGVFFIKGKDLLFYVFDSIYEEEIGYMPQEYMPGDTRSNKIIALNKDGSGDTNALPPDMEAIMLNYICNTTGNINKISSSTIYGMQQNFPTIPDIHVFYDYEHWGLFCGINNIMVLNQELGSVEIKSLIIATGDTNNTFAIICLDEEFENIMHHGSKEFPHIIEENTEQEYEVVQECSKNDRVVLECARKMFIDLFGKCANCVSMNWYEHDILDKLNIWGLKRANGNSNVGEWVVIYLTDTRVCESIPSILAVSFVTWDCKDKELIPISAKYIADTLQHSVDVRIPDKTHTAQLGIPELIRRGTIILNVTKEINTKQIKEIEHLIDDVCGIGSHTKAKEGVSK